MIAKRMRSHYKCNRDDNRRWSRLSQVSYFYREDIAASKRDSETLCFLLKTHFALARDLFPHLETDRTLNSLLPSAFISHAYCEFVKLISNLLRRYYNGEIRLNSVFMEIRMSKCSMKQFISFPLKKLYDRLVERDCNALKLALQWLEIGTHLNMVDLDLLDENLSEYYATEERIESVQYLQSDIVGVRSVLREWFAEYALTDDDFPRHSSGATLEYARKEASKLHKWEALGSDAFLHMAGMDTMLVNPAPTFERKCRIVFVPKSMSTNRVISAEPSTLQYLQHAIQHAMDTQFKKQRDMRKHIHLHNQSFSQALAREGSVRGRYATIDLSAASDSVTVRHIKLMFPTLLRRHLLATRSYRAVMPDNTECKLHKFAPMGSTTCFPVETVLFAAIVESCARDMGIRNPRYVVYGDDMVVPQKILEKLVDKLTRLGFKVNTKKSFWRQTSGPGFREACGIECYSGYDVTPYRISRKFGYEDLSHPCPTGVIESCNSMLDLGLLNVRKLWMREFRRLHTGESVCARNRAILNYKRNINSVTRDLVRPLVRKRYDIERAEQLRLIDEAAHRRTTASPYRYIPFSFDGSIGFKAEWSNSTLNQQMETRYNKELQRLEYRMYSLCNRSLIDDCGLPVRSRNINSDTYRMAQWFIERPDMDTDDISAVRIGCQETGVTLTYSTVDS